MHKYNLGASQAGVSLEQLASAKVAEIPALEKLAHELVALAEQTSAINQNLRAFLDRAGGMAFSATAEDKQNIPAPSPAHAFGRIEEYLHNVRINLGDIGEKVQRLNRIA